MERLTEWNEASHKNAYYPRCFKEPCYGSGCKIKDCPFETAVCERLAAYEDTGLTPDQVVNSKTIIELAFADDTSKAEQIRKLVAADDEGRVVVLPCKVGDTVWRIKRTFEEYPDRSKPYIEPDGFLPQDVINISKTVFLTREEAEKALHEMEGKA